MARDGAEVRDQLAALGPERARAIGAAARARVLAEHTYAVRAQRVEALLTGGEAAVPAPAGVHGPWRRAAG